MTNIETNLLFYAARYAMPRSTGAAAQVVFAITQAAPNMQLSDLQQLGKEIKEAIAREEVPEAQTETWAVAIAVIDKYIEEKTDPEPTYPPGPIKLWRNPVSF